VQNIPGGRHRSGIITGSERAFLTFLAVAPTFDFADL
jgi:hypothetical protein